MVMMFIAAKLYLSTSELALLMALDFIVMYSFYISNLMERSILMSTI
jgi:hypothetical protein